MRKILSLLLTLALLMTLSAGGLMAKPVKGANIWQGTNFTDIQGHWGQASIMKMQAKGLLNGYLDGSYRPDNTVTQEELAVLIDRLLAELNIKTVDDEESNDDEEYLREVPPWAQKAVRNGIMHRYINLNRYHSQVQIDRLTACVELAKALGLDPVTDYDPNPFKDRGLFEDDDDYGYILALYEAGYIKGDPWGKFNPNSLIRRAEMACILDNIIDGDYSDDKTSPTWPPDSHVAASNVGATRVTLSWTAARDNEKVTGYKVIYTGNGETKTKVVGLTRSTTITGLEPDEEYEFTVEARDAAGNWSDDGPSIEVTTEETSEDEDTTRPYWSDESLEASEITDSEITLEWVGAEDNIEVTRYRIYIDDRYYTIDADEQAITVEDLEEDTDYTFRVEAGDEAGNWSTDGPEETFSTTD